MIYFDSDMSKSTNTVVDLNLYLRLRKMSHTIYATNGKVSYIHRRMCESDYTIDKSLVCLQSERRKSC